MKIYIVNGAPQSGKAAFEDYIINKIGIYGKKISTIDFIKEIATLCGWDGEKNLKNRKFLSDLKDLLTEWNDVPFLKTINSINNFTTELIHNDYNPGKAVIFIDCREPKEIEKLKKTYNCDTIIIRRENAEKKSKSNHADANVLNYNYDIELINNGTLKEFYKTIDEFIRKENIYA